MTAALPPPHVVATSTCTGEIHDQGAQVTRWAPAGEAPVLYMSTAVQLAQGRSIRGGIPVCWPWFGPGRVPGMEPAHGFARTAPWQLVERTDDGREATFVHRLTSDEVSSPHWPNSYAVELRSRFGAHLEVSLTTTNTGDTAFEIEEALHTYLAVADVREVAVEGLDGVSYFDKVTGAERVHHGTLEFSGETDAVFRTGGPVRLHDPGHDREVVIRTEGAANLVVWNPWDAKAREVADIGDDDWSQFVCVEGANVFENAVPLAPGESHTLTYRLEMESL
jgi:glucose-6-phosphate 1-epimerase